MDKSKVKTFVVLGMHRSATSLIAKSMNHEIFMGSNLLPPMPDNPKGFFEEVAIMSLNERILREAGGDWYKPPSREAIKALEPKYGPIIKRVLDKVLYNTGHPLVGWKEPRTTLLMDLYLPHLINPHFVCAFREPLEVAKSLHRRNQFTMEFSLNLARQYNERLLEFLSENVYKEKYNGQA